MRLPSDLLKNYWFWNWRNKIKNKPGYTLDVAVNEILGFRYDSDTTSDIALESSINELPPKLQLFVAQQNEYFANYQAALQKKDDQIERLEKLVDSLVKNNIDTANESNNIPKKF